MCTRCTFRQAGQNKAEGCWQPCHQWEKSSAQIYAAVGSSKEKSAAQIVDEHGLDEGLSKPRQEDRLTRIGTIAEFGSVDRGSLHADANSAAQRLAARICEFGSALAACLQMRTRQRAANLCKSGARLGTI